MISRSLPLPLFLLGAFALTPAVLAASPAHLPGELSANQVLDGEYPFPPSPSYSFSYDTAGLSSERLGKVPAPGVHPRVLISPEQLPDIRRRLRETEAGRQLATVMRQRIDKALLAPGWGSEFFNLLAAGDLAAVAAGLDKNQGVPPAIGHYQPYLKALALEALRCLIDEDAAAGAKVGAAIATYARVMQPVVDLYDGTPLNDDTWRMRLPGAKKDDWRTGTLRDIVGYHLLGYAYDFGHPFMTDAQRADVRRLIVKTTSGKLWMGARLPHHLRDWNWVAVAMQTPLMALAIEGEEGYDPRVYKLGVEIARDYLTYGFSPAGSSTEAVGYTQFGLNWLNPFLVAAARRGEPVIGHSHHRASLDWYLHSLAPSGDRWISHGDGGDGGPSLMTALMWRYFYPQDPKADFLWQNLLKSSENKPYTKGGPHILEAILWATDGLTDSAGKPIDYAGGAKLNPSITWFDSVRSSLNLRSDWSPDAVAVQFEARTDSFSASHEHSDRGHFTLTAHGRDWSKENFRSIETRHHSNILVDGLGQGFWPGPGKWLGHADTGDFVVAAIDAKDAYDWVWPKQLEAEPEGFIRHGFERWKDYTAGSAAVRKRFEGLTPERDPRPSIRKQWEPYHDKGGGPRLWDEDTWPVRFPHNPVKSAFRTLAFARGASPYLLIVDDFQKDDQVRLYEWLLQTGENTEMVSFSDGDIILSDATVKRKPNGMPNPSKGDRQLLVRILKLNEPALIRDFQSRPSTRLETFERKDTLTPDGRSFGLDKRLVIGSRSVSPDFQILLVPHRAGDPLPVTTWNADRTRLTVTLGTQVDYIAFARGDDGRTRLKLNRDGRDATSLVP